MVQERRPLIIHVVSRADSTARLAPVPRGQNGSIKASPTSAANSLCCDICETFNHIPILLLSFVVWVQEMYSMRDWGEREREREGIFTYLLPS